MIKTFSQRLTPPFSGQVQIAQSATYRAMTIDGQLWEIQYVNRTHLRVATLNMEDIKAHNVDLDDEARDKEIDDLLDFLAGVELPFEAADRYEYWLLDASDSSPLALIYSCIEQEQMRKFPSRAEWTALPAAVMSIALTDEETRVQSPPVNYRVESLVSERSGSRPRARWFDRRHTHSVDFPPVMVREDWEDSAQSELVRRYIERQAPRLLMLHDLPDDQRGRLESCCMSQAREVARFSPLYPKIIDKDLIQRLRVEARLRAVSEGAQSSLQNRRDGIFYL